MAKILLVDDEKNILQYYTEELSNEGHKVLAVDSIYDKVLLTKKFGCLRI